jgi:hypothetical protein
MQKSSLRISATFVIFNYLAKENNRPMGENSPNLATGANNTTIEFTTTTPAFQ